MPSLLVQLETARQGTGIRFTQDRDRRALAGAARPPPRHSPQGGRLRRGSHPAAAAGGQPAQSAPGPAAEAANNATSSAKRSAQQPAAAQSGVDAQTSTAASRAGCRSAAATPAHLHRDAGPRRPDSRPSRSSSSSSAILRARRLLPSRQALRAAGQRERRRERPPHHRRRPQATRATRSSSRASGPRSRRPCTSSPKTQGVSAGATPQGPAPPPRRTTTAAARSAPATTTRPDRRRDSLRIAMKTLLDLWHDLREKRLWPVAVRAARRPGRRSRAAGEARGRARSARSPGDAPRRRAKQLKQLAKVRARRGRARRRLDAGRLRPGQPVHAAEGCDREGQSDESSDARADTRQQRLRRAEHRRRHRRSAAAAARPATEPGPTPVAPRRRRRRRDDDHNVQVRGRPDLQRQRPHASDQGHGEARHAAEPELAATDLHGRHAQGLGNAVFLVDSTLKAAGEGRCKPSGAECAFAYIGAGSEHVFSEEDGDTYTSGSTRSARSRWARAPTARRPRAPRRTRPSARTAASSLRWSPTSSLRPVRPLRIQIPIRKVDRTAMRRIIIISLTLIAAALLVVPAIASAQKRGGTPAPKITRVQPMRVNVGGTLTITGRNFKAAAPQEHSDLPREQRAHRIREAAARHAQEARGAGACGRVAAC